MFGSGNKITSVIDEESKQEIFSAVLSQDYERVSELLERNSRLSQLTYSNGKGANLSLPYHAALVGDYNICKLLLDHGASVNSGSEAAIFAAVKSNSSTIVNLLVNDYGASCNTRSQIPPYNAPLHLAAQQQFATDNCGMYDLLITLGARENARNNDKKTPQDYLNPSRIRAGSNDPREAEAVATEETPLLSGVPSRAPKNTFSSIFQAQHKSERGSI